jgi:hypothetical protein
VPHHVHSLRVLREGHKDLFELKGFARHGGERLPTWPESELIVRQAKFEQSLLYGVGLARQGSRRVAAPEGAVTFRMIARLTDDWSGVWLPGPTRIEPPVVEASRPVQVDLRHELVRFVSLWSVTHMLQVDALPTTGTRHAFKEWAVAVDSLRDGDSFVTVRKGGIREAGREFRMEHHLFVLFPTFEHQNATQVSFGHEERLRRVIDEAPEPGLTRVNAWAEVTDAVEVTSEEAVRAISEFSVFSPAYAIERLQWRPKKPLHVLVLRVYRLSVPVSFEIVPAYGGCKSWIDLEAEVALQPCVPAVEQGAFEAARATVLERMAAGS